MMTIKMTNDQPVETAPRAPIGAPGRISAFGPTAQAPTAVFEAMFRGRLAELAGQGEPQERAPRRSTITLVVTALRSAADVDHMLDLARGVSATELLAAYQYVDRIRDDSDRALDAFFADPTIDRFHQLDDQIQRLIPQPAAELRDAARNSPSQFAERAQTTDELIRAFDRRVVDIEARLSLGCPDAFASDLDDGCGGGIFHQPHYRPARLGDLMPLRLAHLLGESTSPDADR